jgi:hypothetical protein
VDSRDGCGAGDATVPGTDIAGTAIANARGGRAGTVAGGPQAKELSALGGKVSSPGPGVKSKEGKTVEAGLESVKLLTFGDGNVDKDAVLQAGKTQIKRLEAASQEIVLEILDIGGGLVEGGIKPPGLGLVQKIVDQVYKLAGGIGNFGDHVVLYGKGFSILKRMGKIGPPRGAHGDGSVWVRRPGFPVALSARRPRFSLRCVLVSGVGRLHGMLSGHE